MLLKRVTFVLVSLSVAFIAGAARAQQAAGTQEDEIVVVGERGLEEQVRAFVEALSEPPTGEEQLARWDSLICPGIVGLTARQGQFIADRISARAASVGLQPRGSGCHPNLIVFFAPNP